MQLQVTQENLSKALSTVGRVANSRNSLPILSNVLLKTANNRLSVSTTNLDIAITHFVGSKIASKGAITVPARLTADFVSSLPGGVLDLTLTDNKLKITTEKYESTINGTSAEEFPVMPSITEGVEWSINSRLFKKGLQQITLAASNDDARPVLTGVYIHSYEGSVYMVATDSYRLAQTKLVRSAQDINVLVPATAMQDLLRIIGDGEEEVQIAHDDQQVLFNVSDVALVARLIDGKYPDYRKLIPASFSTTAKLKRADFINITKVSSLFARESAGSITIKVSDKTVSINSIASQLGENTAEAAASVSGGGEITLNSRYLLDALNSFNTEEIEFCFNGKLEPSLIRSPDDPDYTHIVMPLRS